MIERLSHSIVDSLLTCGEKLRLTKIQNVPEIPNWSRVAGNAVHDCTATWDLLDLGIDTGGPRTFEEALTAAVQREEERSGVPSREWDTAGRPSKVWPRGQDGEWWLSGEGQVLVANWSNWLKASPWCIAVVGGTPAVELEISTTVGGHPFVGYIDRVLQSVVNPNHYLVLDIKTGTRTPSGQRQLGAYAVGLHRALGFAVNRGAYFMARKSELAGPFALEGYFDGSLDADYGRAMTIIENQLFIPQPSALCRVCSVRSHCRSYGGHLADTVVNYPKI